MKNAALQNSLTFKTFSPEEVLLRAIKFEQSKQTTQAFQKSYTNTAGAGGLMGSQIKIKQEPIIEIGNIRGNERRTNKEPYKRKTWDSKNNPKTRTDQKQCTRCGKSFVEGHLRNCPAMGKMCKGCNKPNHFARMCRSQQVNEVMEETSESEEECNLIRYFNSCDDFEIMIVDKDEMSIQQIGDYISDRINLIIDRNPDRNNANVRKIDIRIDPRSAQTKSLKALVRIENQIITMTFDTGSPVSFLNWATTRQIMEMCPQTKYMPVESLNLSAQFVDYNKQPILILGALKADIKSAGWEVKGVSFLVTERRTRCILGLDLQSKIGMHTTQKTAPSEKSKFDVLLWEQLEGWKNYFTINFQTSLIVKENQKVT